MAMQSTLKSCHRSGPIINTLFKFNKALMKVHLTVDYPLPEVLVDSKKYKSLSQNVTQIARNVLTRHKMCPNQTQSV